MSNAPRSIEQVTRLTVSTVETNLHVIGSRVKTPLAQKCGTRRINSLTKCGMKSEEFFGSSARASDCTLSTCACDVFYGYCVGVNNYHVSFDSEIDY